MLRRIRFLDYLPWLMTAEAAAGDAGAGGGSAAAAGDAGAAAAAAAAAAGAGGASWSFPADKPFAEYLPAQFKTDPSLRDIKNFDGLVSGYVNAAKLVGMDRGKVLAVPPDDDAAGWDKFYNASGRPESADKYAVPKPAEGKDYPPEALAFQKEMLPVLHKAGLTQRQLNAIVPAWNELQAKAAQTAAAAEAADLQRATSALKTELGTAYDERLGLAETALKHYAAELKLGDDVAKELDRTKLGNSPALFKLFAHLGTQLKEDGLLGKQGGGSPGALSPTEAQQQIRAMEADKDNVAALKDRSHPKHDEVLQKRTRLYEQAYPPAAA